MADIAYLKFYKMEGPHSDAGYIQGLVQKSTVAYYALAFSHLFLGLFGTIFLLDFI